MVVFGLVLLVVLPAYFIMKFGGGNGLRGANSMTKSEFEWLVYKLPGAGTEDYVRIEDFVATVGKPDLTQSNGGTEYWYYNNVAIDPVSGKTSTAQIVIWSSGDKIVIKGINWN